MSTRGLGIRVSGAASVVLLAGLAGCRPAARMGEPARAGDAVITVKGIRFCDQMTDDLYGVHRPAAPGEAFILVDLKVENAGGAPLPVREQDFRLEVAGGASLPAANLPRWPQALNRLWIKTVPPGESVEATAVFIAPVARPLVHLRYQAAHPVKVDLGRMPVTAPTYGPLPKVGEAATGAGLQFTVHAATFPDHLTANYLTSKPKSGQRLCLLDVTVKNLDHRPDITINPLYVALVDAKRVHYIEGGLQVGFRDPLGLAKLAPGQEVRGSLLISVPEDADIEKATYRIGVVGPPVEVSLKPAGR